MLLYQQFSVLFFYHYFYHYYYHNDYHNAYHYTYYFPAGLAFATNAARRGHKVTLFEKDGVIGGQFNMARRIPGKEEFGETLRYRDRLQEKLGLTDLRAIGPHPDDTRTLDAKRARLGAVGSTHARRSDAGCVESGWGMSHQFSVFSEEQAWVRLCLTEH